MFPRFYSNFFKVKKSNFKKNLNSRYNFKSLNNMNALAHMVRGYIDKQIYVHNLGCKYEPLLLVS